MQSSMDCWSCWTITPLYLILGQKGPCSGPSYGAETFTGLCEASSLSVGGSATAWEKDSDCPATPVCPEERPRRALTGAAAVIKC